jgi:putative NADH-flavin reductase
MNLNGQLKSLDSTTVSNVALRRILTAAQQKSILDSQVVILNQRITGQEQIISALNAKDTATVGSYERQIAVMKDERKILEKEVKKIKRKLFWRTVGGVGLTAGLVALYITK